jgi:hypothetical protein
MQLSRKYLLVTLLFFVFFSTQAQVQFAISSPVKEIGKKDELQIEYVISGANGALNFQPPNFEGWELITGPIITQQQLVINGKGSSVVKYGYILLPKKTGKLVIPTTSVEVNGKSVFCSVFSINVKKQDHVDGVPVPGSSSAIQMQEQIKEQVAEEVELKPGEDVLKKINSNHFLKVTVSKKQVYVGEPVLVQYKLYSRLRFNAFVSKQPTFIGCSVTEMTTGELKETVEVINGKKFGVRTFRTVQLFPLQAGKMTVGQVSVDNDISFTTASTDLRSMYYEEPAGVSKSITLTSEPVAIEVLPLPKEALNLPVGSFSITTKLKKESNAANEPNALIVTILGSGNFKSVNEPEIKLPENIYRFDAVEADEIDKISFPLTGKKVFEIPFEVNSTGKVSIAPIEFSFFDPVKGKVQTVSSNSLSLNVTAAVEKKLQQSAVSVNQTGFDVSWLLYLVPLVFIGGAAIIWKKPKKKLQPVLNIPQPEEPVKPSLERKFDVQERYNELLFVQGDAEFYTKAGSFAKDLLESAKGDQETLNKVLKDCNTMLYTPMPITSKKEILDQLKQAIS